MSQILVSYVTAGSGHRLASEAIAAAIRRIDPSADVLCEDFLTHVPPWLRRSYPSCYEWAVRYAPWLWGAVYRLFDAPLGYWLIQPWRRMWNGVMGMAAVRAAQQQPPDAIVTTHFFPADVYAQAKRAGGLRARLIIVVTDLFPHRLWLAPEAEQFAIGSERTAQVCRQRGVGGHRLRVTGIPIHAAFRRLKPVEQAALKQRFGLEGTRRTMLIASGGMGVGPIEQLTTRLAALEATRPGRLQLLVVCGHNQDLERRLTALAHKVAMPMRVFGFIETMPELMAVSDLLVSKPGGLTMAEAMAMGLPMVLCGTIPGQEELNAEELVRHGAGVKANDVEEALAWIERLCEDPQRLAAMREQALAWGRPHAADEIAKLVLDV